MRNLTILIAALLATCAIAADLPSEVSSSELAGTVSDDSGKPIEGALVDVWTWYTGNETKTDKDGHFHLKNLRTDDDVEIRVSKEGFSPWYEPRQGPGVADMKVTLNSKTFFEGTVYSPDGKPLPDVLVRADCGPKMARGGHLHITNLWSETKSDKEGHYKLFVTPDSYRIEARVPEIGMAYFRTSVDPDQGLAQDVRLEPGVRFVAQCVDGDTGQPVAGVKLNVGRHKGMTATSDEKGNAVFEHMPSDSFEFSVSCKGYVKWWSPDAANEMTERPQNLKLRWDDVKFQVSADIEPVSVQLEKGITITGHVVDPEGKPVSGATVATVKSGWGDSIDSTQRFSAKTKADGAFSLILPASGEDTFNLEAHDGDYRKWRKWANGVSETMQTKPGENLNDVTIKLTTSATIKGQVLDPQNNPIEGKWVRVMSADDRDSRYFAPDAHSDKDGNFEIKYVRPGDVLVQVEPFFMRHDDGVNLAINGVQSTVGENEVREGVTLTANR